MGTFISNSNSNTIHLKVQLEIKQIDQSIFDTLSDTTITIWVGYITLVNGSLQGFVTKRKGPLNPSIYNISGRYNKKKEDALVTIILVSNLEISH